MVQAVFYNRVRLSAADLHQRPRILSDVMDGLRPLAYRMRLPEFVDVSHGKFSISCNVAKA